MAGEGGSGGTFLNIPGNIKQKNLPFVLDPSDSMNNAPINVANDENGTSKTSVDGNPSAQVFSFKPSTFFDNGPSAENSGFLRIAPGALYNENSSQEVAYSKPDNDLSYKLLYNNPYKTNQPNSKSANTVNILNQLPSITVREYLQDSKLNQVVNLFNSIVGGWDQGSKLAENAEESNQTNFATKLWKFTQSLMKQLPAILKKSIDIDVVNQLNFAGGNSEKEKAYVMKIPFALYYRMISATTTNVYVLPYNGKILYQSDGTQGWNKDNGIGGMNTGGNSMLGQVFNYLAGNIKVNTTPTWTPKDESQPTKVEMTFDLYNDTLDGALKNFIFINTIVPNNKFLQYHVYQHAPGLYDVRIDGINRLFMCAATFRVDQIGVLRIPSMAFFSKLGKHMNNGFSITSPILLQNYIRIPDIYRVTIAFESLLPDSFNNYIYQYYINSPIPTEIKGNDLRTGSAYEQFSQKISKTVGQLWDNPDADISK